MLDLLDEVVEHRWDRPFPRTGCSLFCSQEFYDKRLHGATKHRPLTSRARQTPMRIIVAAVALGMLSASGLSAQQPAGTGPAFVLFVDDLHIDFRETPPTRELVKRVAAAVELDGNLVGIVTTGTSSVSERLTADRQRLALAMLRITGGALRPEQLLNASQTVQGQSEIRHRIQIALATALDVVTNLRQNRPAAVIYIGNGYQAPPDSRATAAGDDLRRELGELIRAADSSGIAVHTLWTRGLIAASVQVPDSDEWRRYLAATREGLRILAENTGGVAVADSADLDIALQRITETGPRR
jgi:hypothetical protein